MAQLIGDVEIRLDLRPRCEACDELAEYYVYDLQEVPAESVKEYKRIYPLRRFCKEHKRDSIVHRLT
jgi:hypothetical protein